MNTRERPIGVFDSGIGGLTVVRALRELLPNENIFYLGDTARVPYGGKSAAHGRALQPRDRRAPARGGLQNHRRRLQHRLGSRPPETGSDQLRPGHWRDSAGAAAAVAATRNGHIGVIGTRATIKSGAYERAICALDEMCSVTARACPLFVPLIEEGWLEGEITDHVVRKYLEPLVQDGIDTLVLGCTHYPLLREAIGRFLGDSVKLVDSAQNCATAVRDLLEGENLRAAPGAMGNSRSR